MLFKHKTILFFFIHAIDGFAPSFIFMPADESPKFVNLYFCLSDILSGVNSNIIFIGLSGQLYSDAGAGVMDFIFAVPAN